MSDELEFQVRNGLFGLTQDAKGRTKEDVWIHGSDARLLNQSKIRTLLIMASLMSRTRKVRPVSHSSFCSMTNTTTSKSVTILRTRASMYNLDTRPCDGGDEWRKTAKWETTRQILMLPFYYG